MNQFALEKNIVDGENNQIIEVVVFTDQAYIKRQANIQSEIGLNRFLLEINAFRIDKDSIQAAIFGHGEILTVQYRQLPVLEAVQQDVRELDDKKRQLEQQKKIVKREIDALKKQQKFLDATVSYADIEIPKELKTQFPSPENLQNMLNFLEQNYKQLNLKETELEQQLEQLDDEINLIQRKIKQLKKPSQANKQYIEILFVAEQQEVIRIDAFYVAGQASWKPVYKVDVPSDLSAINLTRFAQIEQTTGENWQNVSLSVSNAVPLKGSKLPDLKSWQLHLSSSKYIPAAVALDDSPEMLMGAAGAAEGAVFEDLEVAEPDAPQACFSQAEQKELPLAFEFKLPQTVSLQSGVGDTIFPTSSERINGNFFYLCMPKQDPLVYLVCEASMEKTLLSGKLNIYFAGRFVASSFLDEKLPGQELLFNLGAERDVKVAREKVVDKLTDSFFGVVDRLSAAREFVYRIGIENLKNKQINLRLVEAAPISSSDRIQVKELEYSPEPSIENWQDREGVMLWNMLIGPNLTKELKISFFIKYPKDDPPYEI